MPNKNTPNGQLFEQYQREYQRISQVIRRNKKLGYTLPENLIPVKPSKLEYVTQELIAELQKMTPQELRLNSIYVDSSSGEVYTGVDHVVSHHKAKPSQAKVKPLSNKGKRLVTPETEKILYNTIPEPDDVIPPIETSLNLDIIERINNLIADFEPPMNRTETFIFRKIMNHANIKIHWEETISREGEYAVAYRLENCAEEFYELARKLMYESESETEEDFQMSQFVTMLTGKALTAWEADEYDSRAAVIANDIIRGFNG